MFFSVELIFAQPNGDVYRVDSIREVLITSDKHYVKLDNNGAYVFDAKKLLEVSSIENAADYLEEIPLVFIEKEEYNIVGAGKATVTINGRITELTQDMLFDYLAGIEATRIRKIEIYYKTPASHGITGPSINFIISKARSEQTKLSGSAKSTLYQAKKFYPIGNLYGLLESKKWSLDMTYAIGQGKRTREVESKIINHLSTEDRNVHLKDRSGADGIAQRVTMSYNYDLASGNMNVNYYYRHDDNDTHKKFSATDNGAFFFDGTAPLHSITNNNSASADYTKGNFRIGGNLAIVNIDSEQKNNAHLASGQDSQYETFAVQKTHTYNAYLSDSQKIGQGKITYGAQLTYHSINTTQSSDLKALSLEDNNFSSDHKETDLSFFTGWSQKVNEKLSINADLTLKYQNAKQTTDGKKENLWDRLLILPDLNLVYRADDNHDLQFSVTSQNIYPTFAQNSPRVYISSFYYTNQGNPSLKPSKKYSFNLNYTIRRTYTIGMFASLHKDMIAQYFMASDMSVNGIYSFANLKHFNHYGVSSSVLKGWTPNFNQKFSVEAGLQDINCKIDNKKLDKTSPYFATTLLSNLTLNKAKTLVFNCTLTYKSRMLSSIYSYKPEFDVRTGLTYRMPKQGWNFTLQGSDILGTAKNRYRSLLDKQNANFIYDTDSQMVVFTAKYTWRGYKERRDKSADTSRTGL